MIEEINGQTGLVAGCMIQIDIEAFTKEETETYLKDKASNLNLLNIDSTDSINVPEEYQPT